MKKLTAAALFLLMTGSTLIVTASAAFSQIPSGYIDLMIMKSRIEKQEKEIQRLERQTPKKTQTRAWKKSRKYSKNK
jgi:hypothetical protein